MNKNQLDNTIIETEKTNECEKHKDLSYDLLVQIKTETMRMTKTDRMPRGNPFYFISVIFSCC